jgi:hypothetical protein
VQIFDQNGKLLTIWSTELIGPAFLYVDKDDIVYIPEHPNGARIGGSRNNFMRTLLRSRLLSSAPTQSTSCARPV